MMDPAFDHDETGDYQSLSPLAAIALVLGLLSPAALIHPILMILPLAAAGTALLALGRIRSSGGALTGANVARWGLALAVVFGAATLVRTPVRNALIRRQTTAVAEDWLTAIAKGRIDDSFRLLGSRGMQSLGPPPGGPEAEPPKMEDVLVIARANLRAAPITKYLAGRKLPLKVAVAPAGQSAPVEDGTRFLVGEEYTVAGAGDAKPRRVQLQFTRSPAYESEGRPWRIDSWALVGEPAESASAGPGHDHAGHDHD
jgi:hypothetical protein